MLNVPMTVSMVMASRVCAYDQTHQIVHTSMYSLLCINDTSAELVELI